MQQAVKNQKQKQLYSICEENNKFLKELSFTVEEIDRKSQQKMQLNS